MQKLFKTIDGEIFTSEGEAKKHENDLLEAGLQGLQLDVDDFLKGVVTDDEDYHCMSTHAVVKSALLAYLDKKLRAGVILAHGKLYPGGGNTPVFRNVGGQ